MLKIKLKKTGKIVEATRNEAFDLIERGLAERYTGKGEEADTRTRGYHTRQLRPRTTK